MKKLLISFTILNFVAGHQFYLVTCIAQIMAIKRIHNPKTHSDSHIAKRDLKNYTKGQITGKYKNKKKS
jgi:hypothetical protein